MSTQLAASLSILSDLTSKKSDLFSIVADMSLFALCITNTRLFTTVEAATKVNEFYSFTIPVYIVKTGLRRLHTKGKIESTDNAHYIIPTDLFSDFSEMRVKLDTILIQYKEIIDSAVEFIKKTHNIEQSSDVRDQIEKTFNDIIIENGVQGKFSTEILSFLISREGDTSFVSLLNSIKCGNVIYAGICSVRDLNALGNFNYDLTLILSTDVIFSLHGLNGQFRQDIFNEFYTIISDINTANRARGKKERITLAYLPETLDEIEKFYYNAEQIVSGKGLLIPTKDAMVNIVNGCASKIDVVQKKITLLENIKKLNILPLPTPRDSHNYIVESQEVVDGFLEETAQKKKVESEDILRILSIFTTINTLRKGDNRGRAETSKYLYVAEKKLVFELAKSMNVKFNEHDAYFAANLDYLINRLWFIHNKGLSGGKSPASFSTIIRAQLALSSKLSDRIFDEYKMLLNKLNSGTLDKGIAESIYADLASRYYEAEEITAENIDDIVNSINFLSLDSLINEHATLKEEAKKGTRAKKKIDQLYRDELGKEKKPYRAKARRSYLIMSCVFFALTAAIGYLGYLFLFTELPSPRFGDFAVRVLAGAVLSFGSIVAYFKKVRKWAKQRVLATYKKDILGLKAKILPRYQL